MKLKVRGVTSGYQEDLMILNDVSIEADENEVTSIIGPNGAGKSTLLKTIFGYLKPREGSIHIDGKEITGKDPATLPKEKLAYIPQRRSVFTSLTVEENLKVGAWTFRKDEEKVERRIKEVYEEFPSLKEKAKSLADELSGGQQRMLELGRVLMLDAKIILVDEPTAGLAPKIAEDIYNRLDELSEERGVLMVDQNIKKALELSDRIYVLRGGRVEHVGRVGVFDKDLDSLIRDWLM